jgi:hypothetical protein
MADLIEIGVKGYAAAGIIKPYGYNDIADRIIRLFQEEIPREANKYDVASWNEYRKELLAILNGGGE